MIEYAISNLMFEDQLLHVIVSHNGHIQSSCEEEI